MNILFLRGFNNYFNRIVLKYDTLAEYENRSNSYLIYSNINFNPNDNVIAELVIGSETQIADNKPLDWEDSGSPDYCVCYETVNNTTTIKSRWFITESVRTRLGQYKLTLKRDSIADHMAEVTDATCFIEKGIIENVEDSALYNKEDITTNQIKSDEFLIKDETQCGWVVGYVAKQSSATDSEGAIVLNPTTFEEQTISATEANDSAAEETFADIEEFYAAHPEVANEIASLNYWKASVRLDIWYGRIFSMFKTGQKVTLRNDNSVSYNEVSYQHDDYLHSNKTGLTRIGWKWWESDSRKSLSNSLVNNWKSSTFKQGMLDQISNKESILFATDSELQAFFNYIKRYPTVKIGTKYYKVYDKYSGEGKPSTVSNGLFVTLGSTCYNLMLNNLNMQPQDLLGERDNIVGTPGPETFRVEYSYDRHALELREVFPICKAKIPANVPVLKDAPYTMFAIPYSNDLAVYSGDTLHCVTNQSVAMNAAQALASKAGAGAVYDIQLLPYCPIRDVIKTEHKTDSVEISEGTFDVIPMASPGGRVMRVPIVKLNHQYTISKDITFSSSKRLCGLCSASPIHVKIGEDLEHPTQEFDCKKIEVRYEDIEDLTSDVVIMFFQDQYDEYPDDLPIWTSLYSSYASGDDLISLYFTDICQYGNVDVIVTQSGSFLEINYYNRLPNTRYQPSTNPHFLDDYFFFQEAYYTKFDIANATTSDIVLMNGGTEGDPVNVILWCTESQFSFNKYIDNYFLLQADGSYKQDAVTSLIAEHVKEGQNTQEIKVRNQADMMRLAAPNYSNFFDINVQRNKGVEYINIDCTYKPYAPYIHLNPNFKGLYGADYNDVRGLICGGDYSVALTTDAWATYQLQNKNYQAVFDRQIQHLETTQDIQRQSDVANAIVGTFQGGSSGAVSGGLIGGGYGAIIGAVTGTLASGIGGMGDVYNNQRLRESQMSMTKDIHNYQLENIKALPQGLAKTSYLTNNNKLFPFLEFYTCTDIEEQAIKDKLDYNGMTINRIGKISEFQSENELPYIKAKLIRIKLVDDSHQVNDIANELAAGVYLPKEEVEEVEGD